MKVEGPKIYRFLGWNTQGDLGPYTMYSPTTGGLVFYTKAPPKEPASHRQIRQRNRFRLVGWLWKQLSIAERIDWERAAQLAHLRITGYDLFTYLITKHDERCIESVERVAGFKLTKPRERV